jgi:hypothetical protein
LRDWIPPESSPALASGAGLGALRGGRLAPFKSWSPAQSDRLPQD